MKNWSFRAMRARLFAAILSLFFATNAFALAVFSRAFPFSSPTSDVQSVYYLITRHTVGGVPVNQQPAGVKLSLWALESITADYGEFRFWLLAYSGQYVNNVFFRAFQSNWRADSLFDNNRGLAM